MITNNSWVINDESLFHPKPNLLIMLLVIELGLDKNVWLLEPVELCGEFNWGSCEIWIPKKNSKLTQLGHGDTYHHYLEW